MLYKIKNKKHFYLKVDEVHTLYVEESGNPNGIPIICLHGGPGIPMKKGYKKMYNQNKFRVISFHQRGCGLSTPRNSLYKNKTKYTVEDIEKIRLALGIKKWIVEGISWGATLATIYAINHPDRCIGVIIGGLSLMNELYEASTKASAPDVFYKWLGDKPNVRMRLYMKNLLSRDATIRGKAAKDWNVEERLFELMDFENYLGKKSKKFVLSNEDSYTLALMECYYYMNRGFIPKNYILKNAHKLNGVHGFIIHGRYDLICSCENSYKLSKVWKTSKLIITDMAGHSFRNKNNFIEFQKALKHFEKT